MWALPRAAAVLIALLAAAAGASDPTATSARAAARSRVVLIVLENHEYEDVAGSPDAPFLNGLARRGALANRDYAVAHPSLPNYLALLGGSTFGITDNCLDCNASGSNLALQLSRAGVSWRAYMEDMPSPCFEGDGAGNYVKRHDPFMYFPSIAARPGRCKRVVPATSLDADLDRGTLPSFVWITPNVCNDAHNCSIATADEYLADLVPRLTRRLGPRGLLIVTFDEGKTDLGCCGKPGGGRVMTVLAGPRVRRGAHLHRHYNHYSLLATIEDAFGLRRLRHARGVRSLRAAFRPTPR